MTAARRLGETGARGEHFQESRGTFASVAVPACRFVVANIQEAELRDEYAFNLFEPDVALEVGGKNAFEPFGRRSLPVVIMASREVWLRETADLVRHLDRGIPQWEYHYPLYGTLNEVYVTPSNGDLEVFVNWQQKGQRPVGTVRVREWVQAVATVSRKLSDLFRRHQPSLFRDSAFAKQDELLQEIESWLITHGKD